MYIQMYIPFMPRKYSVAEARTHLPAILDQVEAGADVEITRRGRRVAVLMSSVEYERLRAGHADFATAYAAFLADHSLADVGVSARFTRGLRDRSPGRKVEL